jgi:hypothetical protein
MKPTIAFCIAFACATAALFAAAAAEDAPALLRLNHNVRHTRHHVGRAVEPTPAEQAQNGATAPPASSWLTRLLPNVRPYPPGQGDTDGLSRNIDDCNKGCIGVTPR